MLKKNVPNKITLLFVFLFLACQSDEQPKESTVKENPPVTIANSEQFALFSSNTQQDYKIYIHLPSSYSRSDTTYPVIYGLDADIGFGMTSEMCTLLPVRKEMPEVIIVGIAYGAYPGPVIDSKYRTNPNDRTLSGASLSGLFSLYVLFQHPDIFNRYKISSPSLWWDNGATFELEKKYSEKYSDLPARVFLSVGDVERTVESWQKLVRVLEDRNYKGLKLTTMIFDDAPHLTACILAGGRGIKAVFADD
jgi:predicted alpha/beta superfamily hydrolase